MSNQEIETVEVVKIYGNKVWVESDFFGSKHVMAQSEAPGTSPFCYCSFNYEYGYTDNRSVHEAALRMAISLGASEPVEFRQRDLNEALKQRTVQQEPVGEVYGNRVIWRTRAIPEDGSKLYTSAPPIPDALFDGFAVYQMVDDKAKERTSPENVSDTLDAVVKLLRSPSYIPIETTPGK